MAICETEMDETYNQPLGRWPVFYYGIGHMLNDITAACWFTYLLVFLTEIGLSPRNAATVMLSGQIADAFATIFAGELIDRFGKFKIWHGAGSVLVAASFSSVFGDCLPCKLFYSSSEIVRTVSYSTFAAIFNMGWAATQVANLSLYAVALVVFSIRKGNTYNDIENKYRWIAYASIFIGCLFVGIFHLGTTEPRLKSGALAKGNARIPWTYWFKRALYFQVAVVYVLVRLVLNVSQAFLAFYVINDLQMVESAKALVPAIIYICSFIVSIILQEVAWNGRRLKGYFYIGGVLWIFCGAGILILPSEIGGLMYMIAVFVGIANALMMVTGTGMQNFLIGQSLDGCAFVCGSLSFLDKISCGLALYILQSYQNVSPPLQASLVSFSVTRYGLGLVPAVCALVGIAVSYTMDLETHISKPLGEPLLV